MPSYIIHKDGAYNLYSTISDGAEFNRALTLEELTEWYRKEYGESGMHEFQNRLDRAHQKGTSSKLDSSLEDCVSFNRAGPRGGHISFDSFVAKFLILQKEDA